jgi:outer membrane protein assembly complex protein YaeT
VLAVVAFVITRPSVLGPEIIRRVEAGLAAATGCEARVGSASARIVLGTAELRDVTLTCGGREVARVPRLEASVSLLALIRGRVDIERLELESPVMRLDATAPPWRQGSEVGATRRLAIGEIVASDADLLVTNLPRGAELHLRAATLRAFGGRLGGVVRVVLDSPDADGSLEGRAITGASLRGSATWRDGETHVDELHLAAPGIGVVEGDATLRASADGSSATGHVDATLDLAATARLAGVRSDVAEGSAHVEGAWRLDAGAPSFQGDVAASSLLLRLPAHANAQETPLELRLEDVKGRVSADEQAVEIADVTAGALEGSFSGRIRLRRGPQGDVLDVQGELRDASSDAIPALPGLHAVAPHLARVDVEAQVAIPLDDARNASGGFAMTARPDRRAEGRLRIGDSQAAGRIGNGAIHVAQSDLRVAGARASVTGSVSWDGALDLTADISTPRIGETLAALDPFVPALDEIISVNPRGEASWRGDVSGSLASPALSGSLAASHFELAGLPIGELDARLTLEGRDLIVEHAMASGPLGDVGLDLSARLESGGRLGGTWSASRVDLAAVSAARGAASALAGVAEGSGRFLRDDSGDAAIEGIVSVARPTAFGVTADEASVDATVSVRGLRVREAHARRGDATALLSGLLPWRDGSGRMELHAQDVSLPLDAPEPLARMSVDATIVGSLRTPGTGPFHARFDAIPAWSPLTALVVEGEAAGADALALRLTGVGADFSGEGTISLQAPHDLHGTLHARGLGLPLGAAENPATIHVDSLNLDIAGRSDHLAALRLDATAEGAEIGAAAMTLRASQPLHVHGDGHGFELEAAHFDLVGDIPSTEATKPGAGVDVSAALRLDDVPTWRVSVVGLVPARALQPPSGSLSLSGLIDADVRVEGRGAETTWSGRAEVHDGHLKPVGYPHALDDVEALVTFDGHTAQLEHATCTVGGGPVTATGHVELAGQAIESFALMARGEDVALRLPRGAELSTVSDFDLAWAGTPEASKVTGQVHALEAVWRQDVHLESSALRRSVRRPAVASKDPLDAIALDVRVVGDEGLFIDDDLAHVESHADLQVRGTLARPVLTGTAASIDEGRLTVQGVSYRLLGASAQFTPSHPNDPALQAQAETDLNGAHVVLSLSGRLSDPRIDLTSDPPMPRERIVALLLTDGALGEPASGEPIDPESGTRLGPFAFKGSSGVDLLQIDPFGIDGQGERTARLTIGKYLTPRLFAAYSTFLAGAQEQAAEVRYALRPTVALRLAREADGSAVLGVRYDRGHRPRRPKPQPDALHVVALHVNGSPDPPGEAPLRKALGFEEGDDVSPRAWRRGARSVRQLLREGTHPLARVTCAADPPDAAAAEITCTVTPGPSVEIEMTGLDRGLRRKAMRAVRDAWGEVRSEDDLVPEALLAVRSVLLAEGHPDATADGELRREDQALVIALVAAPGPLVRIASVEIQGTDEVAARDVERLIAASGFALLRNPPLTPAREEDARRVVAGWLVERGYLDAELEPARVEPAGKDQVRLVLVARPGMRAHVASVVVEGASAVSEQEVRELFALEPGELLAPLELDASARKLEDRLDALGHPDATVSWHAEPAEAGVDVHLEIVEGAAARVGRVVVEGREHVSEAFIRDVVGLDEGAPLRRSDVLDAQARLAGLAMFRRVVVGIAPGVDASGRRDVVVRLDERDRLDLTAGLGWVSDAGPRVSLKIGRRHLLGRAVSLGVDLQAGDNERAEILGGWRRFGGSRIDLVGTAGLREDDHVSFTARRLGLSLEASRKFSAGREARLRYRIEDIELQKLEITPEEAGLENGLLASVGMSYSRDTRDDALDPQRGGLLAGDLVIGSKVLGSEAGWAKLFVQHARTLRLSERWSYAGAVRLGLGMTLGGTDVIPVSERFFAGGTTSVRGFSRDKLGPLDADGHPLGGAAVLVFNNEVRYRFSRHFSAVAFLDAGNVWARAADLSLSDLEASAGPGIGIATPAGPVRLYWGFPLDGSDPNGLLHVTFGPTF